MKQRHKSLCVCVREGGGLEDNVRALNSPPGGSATTRRSGR